MVAPVPRSLLRRYFAGITEQAFFTSVGLAEPAVVEYLADLLCRFSHVDRLYCLRDAQGRRLEEIADMLLAAQGLPVEGRTRREIYRHIGDFALFWAGLFPQQLRSRPGLLERDGFVDYCTQGKRSYALASTYEDEPFKEESPVLKRLSTDFELCAFGLNQVQQELTAGEGTGGALLFD